jgi:hypothetical protein
MTVRIGTLSIDGTPISEADMARIEAEEKLHAEQQRKAVRVVAGSALNVEDCRTLLSILGLERDVVLAARGETAHRAVGRPPRRRPAA